MIVLHVFAFALGASLAAGTVFSAIRTFVLPRGSPNLLTGLVFRSVRRLFALRLWRQRDYGVRDRVMALYAPISLVALLPAWLTLVLVGYAAMFWALGTESFRDAFRVSGSSLLTLGFASLDRLLTAALAFSEATIGLLLVALLIAYLPTMYAAFSRREAAVTLLEVRAGSPPSAIEMIKRFNRIHGLGRLGEQWQAWEEWFADIQESHTSLQALVFFRSPRPEHSWVTAAGAVLDAASLSQAVLDVPDDPRAALCVRAGYLALRHIADGFLIRYDPHPAPGDPISIGREEFDAACDELASNGVSLKPDREQAWRDFNGWRVNYDTVLLALASLTMAPPAPWSSDRAADYRFPSLLPKAHPTGRRDSPEPADAGSHLGRAQ